MNIEQKIKEVFQKVLDVRPEEIKNDQTLAASLGIDSTELVEISVAIKKELGAALGDGELKKTQTFNQIVQIVQSKLPSPTRKN
ncbi:MAG: acyl carrier protein [Candidatus Omnitrophica bacterium]|nr:acyl carrier protein [Candidatus Omnitrophota bacterium]